MKELLKYQKAYRDEHIDSQSRIMIIINIITLVYSIVGYFFLSDIYVQSSIHGHTEFKSLLYVSLTSLGYFGAITYVAKPKHKNILFQIGIYWASEFYLLWGIQTLYFSIIEDRSPNVLVFLLVMTLIVSFFTYSLVGYFSMFLLNIIYCIALLSVLDHKTMGIGTILNVITFTIVLAILYVTKLMASLLSFKNKKAYEQATETRKLYSASMNHELRAPLNSIIGNTQILMMKEDLDPEVAKTLEIIFNSSNDMVQQVNDLLDYSKLEAGEFTIVPVEFNLLELKNNLYAMFINQAKEKGLKLEVTISEDTPLSLYGDLKRIQQVAVNIVSNGIKYTKVGCVMANIAIREGKLNLVVRDTGMGMSKDAISELFEPFKRFNEERTTNIQGTGLGMFIVKKLMDQLEGEINCTSEEGVGTIFTLDIPIKVKDDGIKYKKELDKPKTIFEKKTKVKKEDYGEIIDASKSDSTEIKPARSDFDFSGKTILSVDDTVMNNRIIQNLLSPTGADVYCMLDAERCLKYLETNTPDLILLDHMMPGTNGVECLSKIRNGEARIKDIPVIMVTGNGGDKYQELYEQTGANDYLVKPIMQDQLMKKINNLLK